MLFQSRARGAQAEPSPTTGSNAPQHVAVTPVARPDAWWVQRHEAIVAGAGQGDIELIFLGDSIAQAWETQGREVWQKYYGRRKAANFGISGDRTQHVLWRLQHGLLDALAPRSTGSQPATAPSRTAPKLVVLMIGTNNSNNDDHTAREIADGIIAIVRELRDRLPQTKVLLLAIFPRGEKPDAQREKNAEASRLASQIADGRMVHYLDIGPRFLGPDGTLPKDIMPDLLHLSPRGYEIWADAIEPKVKELLG